MDDLRDDLEVEFTAILTGGGSNPTLELTYPVGGEGLSFGKTYNITWESSGISTVKIEYSGNNGGSWSTLAASVNALLGSWSWTINQAETDLALIKVSSGGLHSQSASVFSVLLETVTIVHPDGGESAVKGSTYDITWTYNDISAVKVELSTDNKVSWSTLSASVAASALKYTWTVSQARSIGQCFVRLTDAGGSGASDVSAAAFNIIEPTIAITDPDGGETWYAGESNPITWNVQDITGAAVLYYNKSGGADTKIDDVADVTTGTYSWTLPADASTEVKVKIVAGSYSDSSAAYFTIALPTITITDPDGGETWYIGESHAITWNVSHLTGTAILYYNKSGGADTKIIDVADVTTGTYNWTIPNDASTEVKVKIVSGAYSDSSGAYFTIATPSITVTDPDGGETWYAGTSENITWTSLGLTGNFVISYSSNNGSSWTEIATVAYNSSPKAWTIPSLSSAQCLVKIVQGSYSDQSGAVFTIKNPSVTITDPDGGETWYIGESQPVTWNYVDVSGAAVLYYNKSGGADIKIDDIADVTTGTYNWTIPSDASTEVKVKLVCGSYNDSSAAYFTIATPSITLTEPDGGESLTAGDSFNIEWTSVGITGDVEISYSVDNGANWTAAATVAYDSSPYAWTVPVAISSICLVKIEQGAYSHQSAATFTIGIGALFATLCASGLPVIYTDAVGALSISVDNTATNRHTLAADSHGLSNADAFATNNSSNRQMISIASYTTLDDFDATGCGGIIKFKVAGSWSSVQPYWGFHNNLATDYKKAWSLTSLTARLGYTSNYYEASHGGTISNNTWYFVMFWWDHANTNLYCRLLDATGATLATSAAVSTSTNDMTAADVQFAGFEARAYNVAVTTSHMGYWSHMPSATEIANFVTWANTV